MHILDLHVIKHEDVQKIMDSFLYENMKNNKKEVEIITGISNQMKEIVSNVAKDYLMEVKDDPINPGKVFITLV